MSEYFPDLVKIEMTYSGDRDTATNVMWGFAEGAAGATISELETFANSFVSLWYTAMKQFMSSNCEFTSCFASDWTSATGLSGGVITSNPGTGATPNVPAQVCLLINWLTNGRYRGGHPRTYFPNLPSALLADNQHVTNTVVTDAESNLATFLTGVNALTLNGGPFALNLYHRGPPPTGRVAQGLTPIVGASVAAMLATQRRRVRRVGHDR
jgi:hypothetical protein